MPKRITLENSLAQTWMQGTEEGHVALKGMLDALDNEMIDRKLEGEREIMKLTLEIERVLSSSL